MKLEIRNISWYKRRPPAGELYPIEIVEVEDLQLVDNHRTPMKVKYTDGVVYDLTGRVSVNHVGKWTIAGNCPTEFMLTLTIVDIVLDA